MVKNNKASSKKSAAVKRKSNVKTSVSNKHQPSSSTKKNNIQTSGSNDDIPWSKSKKKRFRQRKRIEAERQANGTSTRLDGQVTKNIMSGNKKTTTENQKPIESESNIDLVSSREINLNVGSRIKAKSSLQSAFLDRLKGSRFRELNEELYTTSSTSAYEKFQKNPELFDQYHVGFRMQVKSWPINPVDVIIQWLISMQRQKGQQLRKAKTQNESVHDEQNETSESIVVADFGCGDAKLAQKLLCLQPTKSNTDGGSNDTNTERGKKKNRKKKKNKNASSLCPFKIHSFDLVSNGNDLITACDMANVPLEDSTVDIGIFSLALMGTNIADFIREAHRVLKVDGILKIAEVRSRFESTAGTDKDDENAPVDESLLETFLNVMQRLGFQCIKNDKSNKMFFLMEFEKTGGIPCTDANFTAKPCIYKRR